MSIHSMFQQFASAFRSVKPQVSLAPLDLYNLSRSVQLGDSGFFENLLRTKGYSEEAIERMWTAAVQSDGL